MALIVCFNFFLNLIIIDSSGCMGVFPLDCVLGPQLGQRIKDEEKENSN